MVGKLEIHGSIWYYLSFLTGMKELYLGQFRFIPRNVNSVAQRTWLLTQGLMLFVTWEYLHLIHMNRDSSVSLPLPLRLLSVVKNLFTCGGRKKDAMIHTMQSKLPVFAISNNVPLLIQLGSLVLWLAGSASLLDQWAEMLSTFLFSPVSRFDQCRRGTPETFGREVGIASREVRKRPCS